MDTKVIQRAFGIMAFLVALVVYLLTVQQTVPFWDCGEFTSASVWQQVPHPPGAPLFLMIGKVFHDIIPFGEPGWRVNLVSVLTSAVTVWLLYLITVMAIKNYRKEEIKSMADSLAVYGSAFVGSLALVFSDTFWFNAVESEVYAMSALFVALVVYLMMKWNEEADNPGHEKYLLLIAYLMGLSTGVHLLALLAIFSIVFLVYFRKYEFSVGSFVITGIISVIVFFVLYPGIVKWVPALLSGNMPFKNECREYIVEGNFFIAFMTIAVIILAIAGLWWSYKRKKAIISLACTAFLLMIFGYSTYTQILLRSNANPPMNENEPKDFKELTKYLGREQYGDSPLYPRRYHSNDEYFTSRYEKRHDNGEYVYGAWIRPTREEVQCKDGHSITLPKFTKTNFMGEMTYLFKYQIWHMYVRYFLWNYVGRISDVQDADYAWFGGKQEANRVNHDSGYKDMFPVKFWGIPLLIGFFGMFFHFYKDPKMAFLYLMLFLMMGVFTAIAQNQQNPQPRERDYFYAGSFFVFCFWIGMAVYGLYEIITNRKENMGVAAGLLAVVLLIVPVNMAFGGWKLHSRAGNFIPFDYSYNILQSTAENAIIFTNGDNDTFPLWYLQDVAGVRRDVRVVNLSLGNTLWYVDQLKNRSPWGAEKIPLSFADDSLQTDENDSRALSYDFGEAQNVSIPVRKEILSQFTDDPATINRGRWDFTFTGKKYYEKEGKTLYLYRVQDKLVLDILRQVKFERPIYYSVTVGPDAFCSLENYFRYEGMAMRICPVQQRTSSSEPINPEVMEATIMNIDNSSNYSTEQKYGFKFRNLNNQDVFYDEVHRRLMVTYRTLFMSYANWSLSTKNDPEKATSILDTMNHYISPVQFPMSYESEYQLAKLYNDAGKKEQAARFAKMGIKSCRAFIDNPNIRPEISYYETTGRYVGPYRMTAYLHEMLGDYQSAIEILQHFYSVCERARVSYQTNPQFQQDVPKVEYNMLGILTNIDEFKILDIKQKFGEKAALDSARSMYEVYNRSNDPTQRRLGLYMEKRIQEMGGSVDSNFSAVQ